MSPREVLRETWATPWKARNEIERLLLMPLAMFSAWGAGIEYGAGAHFYGLPIWQKHRRSRLVIGSRASFRSSVRSNPLGPAHACLLSTREAAAVLTIGDDFGMTGGAIVCAAHITIGHRVFMGANSVITDTDFHPLDPQERQRQPAAGRTAPVTIGDDVFIGMQVLILKGVTVGAGAVIGAGSVVTRDVPVGAVVAGNPARIVRDPTSSQA